MGLVLVVLGIKVKKMNKYKQGTLEVLSNKMIDDQHFILSFDNNDLNPEPGQFIMLDCVSQGVKKAESIYLYKSEPLLLRPFSFYLSSTDGDLSVLYKVKEWGKGTSYLTKLKEGDKIAFRGPLGKPIDINKICKKNEYVFLIAGGVGIAPITFLAQKLIKLGYTPIVYFGVQELGEFSEYCVLNLKSVGVELLSLSFENIIFDKNSLIESDPTVYTVDQKYMSYSVFIGDMKFVLDTSWCYTLMNYEGPVFICASMPVVKYVHHYCAKQMGKKVYIFMEERMSCGMGVCCGCNIGGHLVCQKGPCLNSKDIFKE